MKKLILVLFLTASIFATDKYYACALLADKSIKSSWKQDESLPVKSIDVTKRFIFNITQLEYEGTIQQATIDAAYTQAIADKKDINKRVDELLICALLVLLDYQNNDIKTKTPAQFRADVITKYNVRNS